MEPRRKLRIAVLVKRFSMYGGMERYAVEVTRRLRDMGHEVDLFAREADSALTEGMTFHRVSRGWGISSVLSSVSFAREVSRAVNVGSYDIVHSHERSYSQDVLTVHTYTYKKGMKKYSGIRRLINASLSPRSMLYFWLERRQMATDWLIAVSEEVKRDLKEQYGREQGVHVITPGVDTAWFNPSWVAEHRDKVRGEENIPHDKTVVLFVGSEYRRKGLDYLIPAIGPDMYLLIVGRGERHGHYRRLVAARGLAERVRFVGWCDDVRRLFAASDVVALPAVSEAFGMSVLEGMACGLSVVTSSNAGVAGLIRNGINGFCLSDYARIPEILRRLKAPGERSRIGLRARETAMGHTWDAVAARHEELYYDIVGRKERTL